MRVGEFVCTFDFNGCGYDFNVCGCFIWDALRTGLASAAAAAALPPVDPHRVIHKGTKDERRVKSKLDERQSDLGR